MLSGSRSTKTALKVLSSPESWRQVALIAAYALAEHNETGKTQKTPAFYHDIRGIRIATLLFSACSCDDIYRAGRRTADRGAGGAILRDGR
jgi:hypothetical protein